MKSIWSLMTLIAILAYAVSQIKTVSYIPFKNKTSHIINMSNHKIVTLDTHYFRLRWSFPDIKIIPSIGDLTNEEVILLPWNTKESKLQYIKIKGKSFYNTKEGAIQIKTIAKKDDGYKEFLKNRIELTAGGTVVLARGVHKVIERHKDIHYPWKDTRHLFLNSDINILNFKSPLVTNFNYPKSSWVLIGKSIYAKAMAATNIHLVSIAGNHMGDAKGDGLFETIKTLNDHNIEFVGAGKTNNEAYRCKKIIKKDSSFGFLAFNNVHGSIGKPTTESPGIAWLDQMALDAIEACDKQVDNLIVMVNWGTEYTHQPRKKEREWAKKMIESGADLILGDQAHWVQIHENINNAHVSYGLGNYIFDQHWSEKTTEGIIQKFIFYNDSILAIDTIPVKLSKDGKVKEIQKSSDRYFNVLDAYNSVGQSI